MFFIIFSINILITKNYVLEHWLHMMNLLWSIVGTEKYGVFLLSEQVHDQGEETGQKQWERKLKKIKEHVLSVQWQWMK